MLSSEVMTLKQYTILKIKLFSCYFICKLSHFCQFKMYSGFTEGRNKAST